MGEGRGGALLGGEVDHCPVTVDCNWRVFQNNFCYFSSLASTKETYVELSVALAVASTTFCGFFGYVYIKANIVDYSSLKSNHGS